MKELVSSEKKKTHFEPVSYMGTGFLILGLSCLKRQGILITFSQTTTLIQPLPADEDYFVQKGIAWTLRELGVRYPNATWKFLKSHCKEISPVAFTATIEKLVPAKKEELKKMRKK